MKIELNQLYKSSHWSQEKIKKAYENLIPHLSKYAYLAKITNWGAIREEPEVYVQLQEVYDIMTTNEIYRHALRCRPCERMALCAIKDLVNDPTGVKIDFNAENEQWEIDELLSELNTPKEVQEKCNKRHAENDKLRIELWEKHR